MWGHRATTQKRAPLKGRHAPPDVPKTVDEVASLVHEVALKVWRIEAYDDRLGSALRRLWHQMVIIVLLIGIIVLLVRGQLRDRPAFVPFLYILDTEGEVLHKGVAGPFEFTDVAILNHLEDWIKHAREREEDPTLVRLWKAWTKADQMIVPDSECARFFQRYMADADPRKLSKRPRVDVTMLFKKIRSRADDGGEYRLTWREVEVGKTGQMVAQAIWEGDFTVTLEVPKTLEVAQKSNRYGILLSACSWSPQSQIGGS